MWKRPSSKPTPLPRKRPRYGAVFMPRGEAGCAANLCSVLFYCLLAGEGEQEKRVAAPGEGTRAAAIVN